ISGERTHFPQGLERASDGFVDDVGFTGQEADASALLHFRERELDPGAGRWTAPDPLFCSVYDSADLESDELLVGYAYAGNDPVNSIDPTGLFIHALARKIFPHSNRNKIKALNKGRKGGKE